ncbi:nucleoside deaminase [Cryptosporangium arvum]|uniref:Cytosine/adenosine deaminase n=1 Tax=Cryptosporangium arvum DSM 44712 TaxID=927661 RepID=A0A010YJ45_9ACTN|nr:nucleoside deaminase [Cryptosporangium arvum]EXG80240.1 cytosine/adenosine deaminase [Cryptosporangium arvum DSM 44712]
MTITDVDTDHLRTAISVARNARVNGNHPFGATLVDASGLQVLAAENSVVTGRDATGHAETNLVRQATGRFAPSELAEFTLYTSTEPCAMCAGAIYWAGIGRVVYALGEDALGEMTGADPENPTLSLPCREVFARGQREITVDGPVDLPEARAVHAGFWG